MSEASIDELLKNLSHSTMTLKDFIDDSEDRHQVQRSRKEPNERKQERTTNFLNAVRKHANALFRAIGCGWGQTCHERHNAMISLESRCSHQVLKMSSQGSAKGTEFTLLFSWQQQATTEVNIWHETTVISVDVDDWSLSYGKK